MFYFDKGRCIAINADGSAAEFGTLQDISVDFKINLKELHGRGQDAVYVARGKRTVDIKGNFAAINAPAINQLLNGTLSTGMRKVIDPAPVFTIPDATPYEVTLGTVPQSGTFNKLLVVYDVSNPQIAVPMKLVTGTPMAGQFTFNADTKKLTFASADAGKNIQVLYDYTISTVGQTITLTNNPMGAGSAFQLELFTTLAGYQLNMVLVNCMTAGTNLNMKMEDYLIPSFEAKAFSSSADILGYLYIEG